VRSGNLSTASMAYLSGFHALGAFAQPTGTPTVTRYLGFRIAARITPRRPIIFQTARSTAFHISTASNSLSPGTAGYAIAVITAVPKSVKEGRTG
jgi:hypothetical protein